MLPMLRSPRAARQWRPCAVPTLLLLLLALVSPSPGLAGSTDTGGGSMETALRHYEEIRRLLTADEEDGLRNPAEALRASLLEARDSAPTAVRERLPEMVRHAEALVRADGIDAARDAFYALSRELVRVRAELPGSLPGVAWCPMLERSWLQPAGELGNPYAGSEMPRCGQMLEEPTAP